MLVFLCVTAFLSAAFCTAWLVNRQAWRAGETVPQPDLDRVCA